MANGSLKDIDVGEAVDWNLKLTKNIAEMIRGEFERASKKLAAELRLEIHNQLREPLKQLAAVVESNDDMAAQFEELVVQVRASTNAVTKVGNWATVRRGLEEGRERKVNKLTEKSEVLIAKTEELTEKVARLLDLIPSAGELLARPVPAQ